MKRKELIVFALLLIIISGSLLAYTFYEEDLEPYQVKLNAYIHDEKIIEALEIDNFENNINNQLTESTIKFSIWRDKISADGYFVFQGSKVSVSAKGDYRTYTADGLVNFYSGRLQGQMFMDGQAWDIVMNYSDYDGRIKYLVGVEAELKSEGYSVFKFNNYQFAPGLLEVYKRVD